MLCSQSPGLRCRMEIVSINVRSNTHSKLEEARKNCTLLINPGRSAFAQYAPSLENLMFLSLIFIISD